MEINKQAVYAILNAIRREGIVMQGGVLKRENEKHILEEIEYTDLLDETRYLIELNLPSEFIKRGILKIYDYLMGKVPIHFQKIYSVITIEPLED